MGNKLPPRVSINDSDAPWNQPAPSDKYLPARCKECGFRANTFQEIDDHEHDWESFKRI